MHKNSSSILDTTVPHGPWASIGLISEPTACLDGQVSVGVTPKAPECCFVSSLPKMILRKLLSKFSRGNAFCEVYDVGDFELQTFKGSTFSLCTYFLYVYMEMNKGKCLIVSVIFKALLCAFNSTNKILFSLFEFIKHSILTECIIKIFLTKEDINL